MSENFSDGALDSEVVKVQQFESAEVNFDGGVDVEGIISITGGDGLLVKGEQGNTFTIRSEFGFDDDDGMHGPFTLEIMSDGAEKPSVVLNATWKQVESAGQGGNVMDKGRVESDALSELQEVVDVLRGAREAVAKDDRVGSEDGAGDLVKVLDGMIGAVTGEGAHTETKKIHAKEDDGDQVDVATPAEAYAKLALQGFEVSREDGVALHVDSLKEASTIEVGDLTIEVSPNDDSSDISIEFTDRDGGNVSLTLGYSTEASESGEETSLFEKAAVSTDDVRHLEGIVKKLSEVNFDGLEPEDNERLAALKTLVDLVDEQAEEVVAQKIADYRSAGRKLALNYATHQAEVNENVKEGHERMEARARNRIYVNAKERAKQRHLEKIAAQEDMMWDAHGLTEFVGNDVVEEAKRNFANVQKMVESGGAVVEVDSDYKELASKGFDGSFKLYSSISEGLSLHGKEYMVLQGKDGSVGGFVEADQLVRALITEPTFNVDVENGVVTILVPGGSGTAESEEGGVSHYRSITLPMAKAMEMYAQVEQYHLSQVEDDMEGVQEGERKDGQTGKVAPSEIKASGTYADFWETMGSSRYQRAESLEQGEKTNVDAVAKAVFEMLVQKGYIIDPDDLRVLEDRIHDLEEGETDTRRTEYATYERVKRIEELFEIIGVHDRDLRNRVIELKVSIEELPMRARRNAVVEVVNEGDPDKAGPALLAQMIIAAMEQETEIMGELHIDSGPNNKAAENDVNTASQVGSTGEGVESLSDIRDIVDAAATDPDVRAGLESLGFPEFDPENPKEFSDAVNEYLRLHPVAEQLIKDYLKAQQGGDGGVIETEVRETSGVDPKEVYNKYQKALARISQDAVQDLQPKVDALADRVDVPRVEADIPTVEASSTAENASRESQKESLSAMVEKNLAEIERLREDVQRIDQRLGQLQDTMTKILEYLESGSPSEGALAELLAVTNAKPAAEKAESDEKDGDPVSELINIITQKTGAEDLQSMTVEDVIRLLQGSLNVSEASPVQRKDGGVEQVGATVGGAGSEGAKLSDKDVELMQTILTLLEGIGASQENGTDASVRSGEGESIDPTKVSFGEVLQKMLSDAGEGGANKLPENLAHILDLLKDAQPSENAAENVIEGGSLSLEHVQDLIDSLIASTPGFEDIEGVTLKDLRKLVSNELSKDGGSPNSDALQLLSMLLDAYSAGGDPSEDGKVKIDDFKKILQTGGFKDLVRQYAEEQTNIRKKAEGQLESTREEIDTLTRERDRIKAEIDRRMAENARVEDAQATLNTEGVLAEADMNGFTVEQLHDESQALWQEIQQYNEVEAVIEGARDAIAVMNVFIEMTDEEFATFASQLIQDSHRLNQPALKEFADEFLKDRGTRTVKREASLSSFIGFLNARLNDESYRWDSLEEKEMYQKAYEYLQDLVMNDPSLGDFLMFRRAEPADSVEEQNDLYLFVNQDIHALNAELDSIAQGRSLDQMQSDLQGINAELARRGERVDVPTLAEQAAETARNSDVLNSNLDALSSEIDLLAQKQEAETGGIAKFFKKAADILTPVLGGIGTKMLLGAGTAALVGATIASGGLLGIAVATVAGATVGAAGGALTGGLFSGVLHYDVFYTDKHNPWAEHARKTNAIWNTLTGKNKVRERMISEYRIQDRLGVLAQTFQHLDVMRVNGVSSYDMATVSEVTGLSEAALQEAFVQMYVLRELTNYIGLEDVLPQVQNADGQNVDLMTVLTSLSRTLPVIAQTNGWDINALKDRGDDMATEAYKKGKSAAIWMKVKKGALIGGIAGGIAGLIDGLHAAKTAAEGVQAGQAHIAELGKQAGEEQEKAIRAALLKGGEDPTKAAKLMGKFDLNGDGFLSGGELARMREAMMGGVGHVTPPHSAWEQLQAQMSGGSVNMQHVFPKWDLASTHAHGAMWDMRPDGSAWSGLQHNAMEALASHVDPATLQQPDAMNAYLDLLYSHVDKAGNVVSNTFTDKDVLQALAAHGLSPLSQPVAAVAPGWANADLFAQLNQIQQAMVGAQVVKTAVVAAPAVDAAVTGGVLGAAVGTGLVSALLYAPDDKAAGMRQTASAPATAGNSGGSRGPNPPVQPRGSGRRGGGRWIPADDGSQPRSRGGGWVPANGGPRPGWDGRTPRGRVDQGYPPVAPQSYRGREFSPTAQRTMVTGLDRRQVTQQTQVVQDNRQHIDVGGGNKLPRDNGGGAARFINNIKIVNNGSQGLTGGGRGSSVNLGDGGSQSWRVAPPVPKGDSNDFNIEEETWRRRLTHKWAGEGVGEPEAPSTRRRTTQHGPSIDSINTDFETAARQERQELQDQAEDIGVPRLQRIRGAGATRVPSRGALKEVGAKPPPVEPQTTHQGRPAPAVRHVNPTDDPGFLSRKRVNDAGLGTAGSPENSQWQEWNSSNGAIAGAGEYVSSEMYTPKNSPGLRKRAKSRFNAFLSSMGDAMSEPVIRIPKPRWGWRRKK